LSPNPAEFLGEKEEVMDTTARDECAWSEISGFKKKSSRIFVELIDWLIDWCFFQKKQTLGTFSVSESSLLTTAHCCQTLHSIFTTLASWAKVFDHRTYSQLIFHFVLGAYP
jgi:hypothetical protein